MDVAPPLGGVTGWDLRSRRVCKGGMDVRVRNMVITLSVAALATLTVTQTASAAGTDVLGLWSSTYTATPTNCGTYSSDANSYCWTQRPSRWSWIPGSTGSSSMLAAMASTGYSMPPRSSTACAPS